MSWWPEILCTIFGAIFDPARRTKLRGKSEAKWFHDSPAIGYCLLPTLFILSAFVSWRTTLIAAGLFIVCLIAGAVTETDDLGAR